jgi:hypothetical protein
MAEFTITPDAAAKEAAMFWQGFGSVFAAAASRAALEACRVCLELDGAADPAGRVDAVADLSERRFAEDDPARTWVPAAAFEAVYGEHGRVVDDGYLSERRLLLAQAASIIGQLHEARQGEEI